MSECTNLANTIVDRLPRSDRMIEPIFQNRPTPYLRWVLRVGAVGISFEAFDAASKIISHYLALSSTILGSSPRDRIAGVQGSRIPRRNEKEGRDPSLHYVLLVYLFSPNCLPLLPSRSLSLSLAHSLLPSLFVSLGIIRWFDDRSASNIILFQCTLYPIFSSFAYFNIDRIDRHSRAIQDHEDQQAFAKSPLN